MIRKGSAALFYAAVLAAVMLANNLPTYAQPVPPAQRPDAGRVLETIRDPEVPKRPDQGLRIPPPRPRMEAPPGIKVVVKGFRISGNTLFTDGEIQPALAEFLNKELDFDALSDAVRAVTSFYRSRGYFLAQAYLPRQELTSGVVDIHVLEGVIGKVEVKQAPSARLRPWIAEGFLRSIERGAIASEADVERPLLLLGDLPATVVQSTLVPGANVGEADLIVEIGDDGRRVTGVVEAENFGNKYAGAIRAGGQVFINNPLGIGDQLSFRGLVSQDTLTEVLGMSYSAPISYRGTKAGFSVSHMRYELGGSLAPQNAHGTADLASLLVVHPFIRMRDLNLFGQISGEFKDLHDFVDAVSVSEPRRVKGIKVGMFGDSRDFLMGGGLNTFSGTVTRGKLELRNELLQQTDAINLQTEGNFWKYNIDLQRVQRIAELVHAVGRFSFQTSNKNLASVEKMSIGGPYGVRAYPIGEGLADEAVLGTIEGRYTVPQFKFWASELVLAAFIDGARVRRSKDHNPTFDVDPTTFQPNENQRTFWGAGVGARLGRAGDYSITVDFAWRMGSEQPKSDVPRHPYFWMRGVKWF